MNLVLVGYTPSKTRAAIAFCDRAFPALRLRHKVLVCNRPGLLEGGAPAGWTLLPGTNAFAEFSGWQQGLDHLLSLQSREAVVFANDTLNTHRRFSAFRRHALVREFEVAPPRSVVGFVDHAENDIGDLSIAGMPLSGWISSYYFLLGSDSLARLRHQLYDLPSIDACVPGGSDESRFFSEELSDDLRSHLRHWLFGGGWYKSEPLTAANQALFTLKARVICAELILSARCWHLGFTRRDPFERHPLARAADRRYEKLMQRFGAPRFPA